jgi:hypothetical protein
MTICPKPFLSVLKNFRNVEEAARGDGVHHRRFSYKRSTTALVRTALVKVLSELVRGRETPPSSEDGGSEPALCG